MRARVLLWICLGLNVLLLALIVLLGRESFQPITPTRLTVQATNAARQVKTNIVVRRQPILWGEIESSDYRAYIVNLRRIGCPEKTIRDIIVADVNDLYAERITKEIVFPEQKWWLPEPDMEAFEAGMNQLHTLEAEKNRLLSDLLGPDWAKSASSIGTIAALSSRETLYADALKFDGPILGKLSNELKNNVRQIEERATQTRDQILDRARQENRQPTPAELGVLQQETRRQLASVLNAEQLEEYLLRYSQTSEQMRDQLRGFGANAEEFRRIFRVRDSFDQQLLALNGTDATTARQRTDIERMRDETLRQEIGPERFSLYQMTQNPLFRQAQEEAEQNGAPPEKVLPIYRVNQAVQDEIARVQADRSISDDQRRIALVTIQQQQRNSIERILGNAVADEATNPVATVRESRGLQPLLPPLPPGAQIGP